MGRAQREKGCRGERLWAAECRKAGFENVERGGQDMYQRGSELADVVGLDGVHQEVKFVERLNVRAAMEQSERDAAPHEVPILAHKTSRKEWLVTMRGADFLNFYRAWVEGLTAIGKKPKPWAEQSLLF